MRVSPCHMMRALRPLLISGTAAMEELKRRLWEEHQVEAPITPWRDHCFIRVSIQAYNSPRDVDQLLDGLARLRW